MLKSKPLLKKTQELIDSIQDKENTRIMFFDEGRFGLRSTTMRMWAEKGKPLSVKVQQGFKNFYGYSAVDPFDGSNFSLILPQVNTTNMNVYLSELSAAFAAQNIILIMDQAGWHKSRELVIPENIKIEYLTPYSPKLNPVEKLWEWIRKEVCHNFFKNTLEELSDAICEEFNRLTNLDYKVLCNCKYLSYFK